MHGESRRLLKGWCVKKCNFTCICILTKKLLEANLFARLSNVEMPEKCTREWTEFTM